MAQYLGAPTLDQEMSAAARYYVGEVPLHLSATEQLAQAVHDGDMKFSEAIAEMMQAELAQLPDDFTDEDLFKAEDRITLELNAAITRLDFKESSDDAPTNAVLRPDLSPALAGRLGIDPSLPLTETGVANLLNATRLNGGDIDGKRVNKPMRDLVDIFGLDPKAPPTGQALENVLVELRADGAPPLNRAGKLMEPDAIKGPQKRFLTALGVKPGQEPTATEMANIRVGKSAKGFEINPHEYQRQVHATKQPLGFVDLTFSMDKTGSAAFALAGSEAERAIILGVHQNAAADAMAFVEKELGWITRARTARTGPSGRRWRGCRSSTTPPARLSMSPWWTGWRRLHRASRRADAATGPANPFACHRAVQPARRKRAHRLFRPGPAGRLHPSGRRGLPSTACLPCRPGWDRGRGGSAWRSPVQGYS